MKSVKELLNQAYSSFRSIPWQDSNLPQELVKLVETRRLKPCEVLDIGCGLGDASIYLASKGFRVVGIDISDVAIKHARENARLNRVDCTFISMDALQISSLGKRFDFVFEWGLLHFIPHSERKKYISDVFNLMTSNAQYISLSFDEASPEWGGGRVRTGLTGSKIYYSSKEELKLLFKPYFKILEIKTRMTSFKNSGNIHNHNYVYMKKK